MSRTAEEWAKEIRERLIIYPKDVSYPVHASEIADAIEALIRERDELREWNRRAVEVVKSAAVEMVYLVEQVNARPGGSVDRAYKELAALLKEAEAKDAKESS